MTGDLLRDQRVAILGGGLMGHALAGLFVHRGYTVTVYEPNEDVRASLPNRVADVIDELDSRRRDRGQLSIVESILEIHPAVGFVIEAAPEDLALKRALVGAVGDHLPQAILASNSSVLRVNDIFSGMISPDRALVTHWWNPPHVIPIVEVVHGPATDPRVAEAVVALLVRLGKHPVTVAKDTPGFIGNRLQHALWREAMALVEEGVCDAATVDAVARGTIGLRLSAMGPLENADYVGLDLTRAIHDYVFPALSSAQAATPGLRALLDAGCLGAKSGDGYYSWEGDRRVAAARRLRDRIQLLIAAGASAPDEPPTVER